MRRTSSFPVFILFYHRVSDSFPNPWTLNCQEFKKQIDWFQKKFRLVSLDECQRLISAGKNDQPTLAITFDDGYAENLEFAVPLLVERKIPFTYFVTVDNVIHQHPFPHDLQLNRPLPVNSIESIQAMARLGIQIGAHTRHHSDVATLNPDQLFDELIVASRELEDYIGQPVKHFAFPYGQRKNLSIEAFELLQQHGFSAACTTLGGWNPLGTNPFELTRMHGDPSLARIKNWLSFDPRTGSIEPYFNGHSPRNERPSGETTQVLSSEHKTPDYTKTRC